MPSESSPISVVLVEDNTETRESLVVLISGSPGFKCLKAFATAEDALNEIHHLNPDVVLMDIQLPGMSGIDCIRRLSIEMPRLQVMMLTLFEDHEKIFQSLSAGASGYVLKKTPPAKLLEAIEELHRGGAPMSGQIARQVVQAFQQSSSVAATAALSPRERQVLDLLAQGLLYKEIAAQLRINISTVRVYIRKIYDKLHVHTRTDAIRKAYPGFGRL